MWSSLDGDTHAMAGATAAEVSALLLLKDVTGSSCGEEERQHSIRGTALVDSSELYATCASRKTYSELGEKLEEQGYLYLRGLLSDSKEDLQALCARVQQAKNPGHSVLLDVTSHAPVAAAASARSSSSYDASTWKTIMDSGAMLRIGVNHNVALQRLFGRLNAHTQSKHAVALPGTWLRVRAAGAEETPAQTDYLHFRSRFPAIFGLPFRPRWSLDEKKLCQEVSVSRVFGRSQKHWPIHTQRRFVCQRIDVSCGSVCVFAELPAPSVV